MDPIRNIQDEESSVITQDYLGGDECELKEMIIIYPDEFKILHHLL